MHLIEIICESMNNCIKNETCEIIVCRAGWYTHNAHRTYSISNEIDELLTTICNANDCRKDSFYRFGICILVSIHPRLPTTQSLKFKLSVRIVVVILLLLFIFIFISIADCGLKAMFVVSLHSHQLYSF